MSDNVGLSTPRGSGTSGYVQRNLAHMRPRDRPGPYNNSSRDAAAGPPKHRQRQPDRGILEHDRKREVEVKVMELRDRLEEEGGESAEEGEETEDLLPPSSSSDEKKKEKKRPLTEDEIDERCDALRRRLLDQMARGGGRPAAAADARGLKRHQVHELADAKIRESERLRSALKISRDYEEGSHWRRQEERLRKALERDGEDEERGGGGGSSGDRRR